MTCRLLIKTQRRIAVAGRLFKICERDSRGIILGLERQDLAVDARGLQGLPLIGKTGRVRNQQALIPLIVGNGTGKALTLIFRGDRCRNSGRGR